MKFCFCPTIATNAAKSSANIRLPRRVRNQHGKSAILLDRLLSFLKSSEWGEITQQESHLPSFCNRTRASYSSPTMLRTLWTGKINRPSKGPEKNCHSATKYGGGTSEKVKINLVGHYSDFLLARDCPLHSDRFVGETL